MKEATSGPCAEETIADADEACLAAVKVADEGEAGLALQKCPAQRSSIQVLCGKFTGNMSIDMNTRLPDLWWWVRGQLCLESCGGIALLNSHDCRQVIRDDEDFLRLVNSEVASVVISGVGRGGVNSNIREDGEILITQGILTKLALKEIDVTDKIKNARDLHEDVFGDQPQLGRTMEEYTTEMLNRISEQTDGFRNKGRQYKKRCKRIVNSAAAVIYTEGAAVVRRGTEMAQEIKEAHVKAEAAEKVRLEAEEAELARVTAEVSEKVLFVVGCV